MTGFENQLKMSLGKWRLLAVVGVGTLWSVVGAYDTTGFVKMTASDAAGTETSFNGAGKWDSNAAPEPGKNYLIPSGVQMYGPNVGTLAQPCELIFAGDKLVIAGTFWPLGGSWVPNRFTVTNCVLLGGGSMVNGSQRPFLWGKCTVEETTAVNPFTFRSGMAVKKRDWVTEFGAELHGDADQVVQTLNTAKESSYYHEYAFVGSQAGYRGTYLVGNNTSLQIGGTVPGSIVVTSNGTYRTWYHYGSSQNTYDPEHDVFNDASVGSLTVEPGGIVEVAASNILTVANLTLKEDAELSILSVAGTNGQIVVTGRLTVEGPVKVTLPRSYSTEATTPTRHSFIRLAPGAEGALRAEDFVLSAPTVVKPLTGLPHVRHVTEVGPDGSKTLVEYANPVVSLLVGENADTTPYSPLTCASNAKGAAYWSDGLAPHAGADYYAALAMNMPATNGILSFAGDSLTIATSAGSLASGNGKGLAGLAFRRLAFSDTLVRVWSGKSGYAHGLTGLCITGETFAVSGNNTLSAYGNYLLDVKSDLIGAGDIKATGYEIASNDGPRGNVELSGDNTGWTGRLLVTLASNTKDRPSSSYGNTVPNEGVYMTLYVSRGCNLGGPLAAFRHNAVTVNQMCKLAVTGDVVLDQINRGLLVEGMARFDVSADHTFTVVNPLTLRGLLRKEGEGMLALGGTLRFGGDDTLPDAAEPAADANLIAVKSGGLAVEAAAAADGAAITIEDGGYLAVRVGSTPATALRSVRTGSSLAGTAADGRIPVRIANSDVLGSGVICTSKDGELKFAVARPNSCRVRQARSAADADGVYTYTFSLARLGLVVSFK